MKRALVLIIGLSAGTGVAHAAAQQAQSRATPPAWAYPINPPAPAAAAGGAPATPAPAPDTTKLKLPGTTATFTRAQVGNAFDVADWHPETHPAMPDVVAKGRQPDVRACGFCHQPNGQGRPENGPVAGLPTSYFIQQLIDFKNGTRVSSEPRMGPPAAMVRIAKAMNTEEMQAAADYFAAIPYRKWVRVVEAATVPKVRVAGGMWTPTEGNEPIGNRIVEVPEYPERTAVRDPTASFVAYVPPGALAKGEALVKTGGGKTTACGACHGADLRGLGPVPPIAGRTTSYLMRQLVDFKSGARAGAWAPLMDGVVAGLDDTDMMNVVAYVASQAP